MQQSAEACEELEVHAHARDEEGTVDEGARRAAAATAGERLQQQRQLAALTAPWWKRDPAALAAYMNELPQAGFRARRGRAADLESSSPNGARYRVLDRAVIEVAAFAALVHGREERWGLPAARSAQDHFVFDFTGSPSAVDTALAAVRHEA